MTRSKGEPVTASEFDIELNYSNNIGDEYKKYFLSSAFGVTSLLVTCQMLKLSLMVKRESLMMSLLILTYLTTQVPMSSAGQGR